jgi:hypothetical protein
VLSQQLLVSSLKITKLLQMRRVQIISDAPRTCQKLHDSRNSYTNKVTHNINHIKLYFSPVDVINKVLSFIRSLKIERRNILETVTARPLEDNKVLEGQNIFLSLQKGKKHLIVIFCILDERNNE